jgi:anti-anti-sigma factor
MLITVQTQQRVTVLILSGDLDGVTSPRLTEALDEQVAADRIELVLDFAEVGYISSAGLRAVLAAVKVVRRRDGDVRLSAVGDEVLKVFDMSGFNSILRLFDDTAEAVRSFDDDPA